MHYYLGIRATTQVTTQQVSKIINLSFNETPCQVPLSELSLEIDFLPKHWLHHLYYL